MSPSAPPRRPTGPAVRVRAPSKVNLYLAVGDVRDDGYHDLVTVFHALDLADELTVSPARRSSVRCTPADGVPAGAKNLAGMAVRLLAQRTRSGGPVAIDIAKQIPVAGGMAGGSADAAAALVGCAALWELRVQRQELIEIGREIGADVPFAPPGAQRTGCWPSPITACPPRPCSPSWTGCGPRAAGPHRCARWTPCWPP